MAASSVKPNRPAPPPPSRPGHVQVVKALYPYAAKRGDELSFEEGDLLYIIDKADGSGWWTARVGNQTGLIPSNYVEDSTETIDNPLHEAAKRGNVAFLQDCLSNKLSVNGLDKSGSTPLHWAASGGHMECAVLLLQVPGISVDVQVLELDAVISGHCMNKLGDTPLHNASWKGYPDIVQALVEHGANKSLKNNEKKTAYHLSRKAEVARLLKEKSVSDANDYGADEEEDGDDD